MNWFEKRIMRQMVDSEVRPIEFKVWLSKIFDYADDNEQKEIIGLTRFIVGEIQREAV